MDRQIVYPGAMALDTDHLLQSRNTMIGLGYLTKMVVGDASSVADGLSCIPGQGMSIVIGPGSMTLPTVIDGNFIGALPPDGDQLVKTGINTAPVTLEVTGSGTFVVAACVNETQGGNAVVAYYNAANPAQTLFGPNGSGTVQASVLQQRVSVVVTAGSVAPSGMVAIWILEVPTGASAIAADMISVAPGAPFLNVKLPGAAPLASPGFSGVPTAPTPVSGDVSFSLATTAFVSGANRRFRATWTSRGSSSWTCPAGVSQVLFRGWGPGGAGGTGAGGNAGGGGGGGGYLEVLLDVVSGQVYAVVVGTGGTDSASVTQTSFGGIVSVFGGGNGGNGSSGQTGVGGTAGSDAVLQLAALSGPGSSSGQAGFSLAGTSIGGAGGGSFGTPSSFQTTNGGAGSPGFWPGGGGSGGCNGAGGNGADGLVMLEWCGNSAS